MKHDERRARHEDSYFCNAKNRNGKPCSQPAGYGTDHLGYGRCKFHGGRSPIKHGFYSKWVQEKVQEKIDTAGGLSPMGHALEALAMQAGLAAEYLARFEPGVALTGDDIDKLISWAEKISRSAERIPRMRQMEAMTVAEGVAILEGFARLAEKYIGDPAKLEAFGKDAADYVRRLAQGKVEWKAPVHALPAGANRAVDNTG